MRDWRGIDVDEKPSRSKDLETLRKLLNVYKLTSDIEVGAFTSMRDDLESNRYHMLTARQRAWAMGALSRFEGAQYENLVSRGIVSGETKVPTIPVLRRENLPKKPPRR